MFRNILHRKTLASFFIIYILSIIQLTGKSNYEVFSKDMDIDAINNPDLVKDDLSLAIKSAIWFWNKNNLNSYCDNNDFIGLTKRINGGTHGILERGEFFNELLN